MEWRYLHLYGGRSLVQLNCYTKITFLKLLRVCVLVIWRAQALKTHKIIIVTAVWQKIKWVPLYMKRRSVHTAGAWLSNCNWGNTAPYLKWAFKNVTATFYGSPSRNKMRNRSTSLSPSLSQVTRHNKSRSGLSRKSINSERCLIMRRDVEKYLLTNRSKAYMKLTSCLPHIVS